MKKLISLFTVISLVLSMLVMGAFSVSAAWDGTTVATGFASGTGTEADPFVIATPEQLAYLAQSVKGGETYDGKFIALSADIDLGGKEWMPIGLYKYENTANNDFPFKGSFDGKGYTVSNYVIKAGNNTIYAGLFGYAGGASCVIKNLTVAKANVAGKNYAGTVVGCFVGKALVGITVEDDCTVTGKASVGGVAGRIVGGEGTYLVNKGTVTGTGNDNSAFIGGICGATGASSVISYCVNLGTVGGDVAFAGGVVGITGLSALDATLSAPAGGATIENCYNAGTVKYEAATTNRYVGGIAARFVNAQSQTTVIKNTYNLGTVDCTVTSAIYGEVCGQVRYSGITFENVFSVDIADMDLFKSGKVADGVDVSPVVNKTEAEIKALTAVIDAKIAENKVTPPAAPETSAPETTAPAAPETTAPETNAPTTQPTTPPATGDVSAIILAAVCVTGLAAAMVAKKKER